MSESWIKKLFEQKPKIEKEEEHDNSIENNQHEFNKVMEEKEEGTPEDMMDKKEE